MENLQECKDFIFLNGNDFRAFRDHFWEDAERSLGMHCEDSYSREQMAEIMDTLEYWYDEAIESLAGEDK